MERFELLSDRGITQDRLNRLSTCEWIDYGQDLVIVGATGSGKSFLAQAVAIAACRKKMSARYVRLHQLADDFDAVAGSPQARKDLLEELSRPAIVVIDDFMATDVSTNALTQVFNLLVARENSSTVIASQHEPDYWYDVFHDAAIADAVLPRLVHNGTKLTIAGADMRTRDDLQEERRMLIKASRGRQRVRR